jgi:hypothetical protein
MAADEGYDRVAIVPGEEQAKRYDLSNQIDHVKYWGPMDNGLYGFSAYTKAGEHGPEIKQNNLTPSQIADHLGKEMADKIVGHQGKTKKVGETQYGILSGLNLKVGGEGMKGFYDKIVPDALNKLTKEYGVKVQINGGKVEDAPVHTIEVPKEMREKIRKKGFPLYSDLTLGAMMGANA